MGTNLSDLTPPRGAKQKPKRLGRGHGSGLGTTAGKGQKGQTARQGHMRIAGFEGGQMPIQRRLPKRGFKNPFRMEYCPVNIARLAQAFQKGDTVDLESLKAKGIIPRNVQRLKILAVGDGMPALTVKAHAFSKAAMEKIQAAGGKAELIQ